jgi:hypothetical protein
MVGFAAPAHAVLVVGELPLQLIDFGFSGSGDPPPLLIGTPDTGLQLGRFTYDTDAVASSIFNPQVFQLPDGTFASSGLYTFTAPGSASLSVTLRGETYSTTARADNPITIGVAGNQRGNDSFKITPGGVSSTASDPTNPLPAFPFLSFVLGTDALPNGLLPTSNFTGPFEDPELFLRSIFQDQQGGGYTLRFRLAGPASITTVPEPHGASAVLVAGLTGLLAIVLVSARGRPTRSRQRNSIGAT